MRNDRIPRIIHLRKAAEIGETSKIESGDRSTRRHITQSRLAPPSSSSSSMDGMLLDVQQPNGMNKKTRVGIRAGTRRNRLYGMLRVASEETRASIPEPRNGMFDCSRGSNEAFYDQK
jgi:hypothetical protein